MEYKMASKNDFLSVLRKNANVLRYLDLKYIGKYFVSHDVLTVEELGILLKEEDVDKAAMTLLSFVEPKRNLENLFRLAVISARSREGPHRGIDSVCTTLFGAQGDALKPLPGHVIGLRKDKIESCQSEPNLFFSLFFPLLCQHLDKDVVMPLYQHELDLTIAECMTIIDKLSKDKLLGIIDLVKLLKSKGPDAFWFFYDALRMMVENAEGPHDSMFSLLEEMKSLFQKEDINPAEGDPIDIPQYNKDKELRDQIPLDSDLDQVSMVVEITLYTNWPKLAEYLSLPKKVISETSKDSKLPTVREKVNACLNIWRKNRLRRKKCTKAALAEALRKVDLVHVSRQLLTQTDPK